MILVGEIEYTHLQMSPDGFTGFLFVGNQKFGEDIGYAYIISPYKENHTVGDKTIFPTSLSVTEYLQYIVNYDISIGRNTSINFPDNVGIRLKGMKDWIIREPIKKIKT